MNLAQLSSLTGRGQGLLGIMYKYVPLLQQADFSQDASTHLVAPDKSTHTGTSARAVGAAAAVDAQVPVAGARGLALYSREITIDNVHVQDQRIGMTVEGLRLFADRQVSAVGVKIAEEIGNDMIAGTDADNHALGIFELVKDAPAGGQTAKLGFTADELAAINEGVNLDLSVVADQNSLIEILELKLSEVPGANAIILNPNLKARMATIARRVGAAGETRNGFGTPLATFNGIPMIPVSTAAISNTQPDGAGNNVCTSLAVVRFDEALGVTYATNSGLIFSDFDLDSTKPNYKARLEMYFNLKVHKTNALRRISRIKL